MVNLNDSDIMETFKSSSKKSKKSAKKDKKSKKKSNKKDKKNCLTKTKSKSKKKKDDLKEDTDYFIESFSSKITDPNLNQYKTKFEESEKTKKVSEFRAANEEEDDQNYQKISN